VGVGASRGMLEDMGSGGGLSGGFEMMRAHAFGIGCEFQWVSVEEASLVWSQTER